MCPAASSGADDSYEPLVTVMESDMVVGRMAPGEDAIAHKPPVHWPAFGFTVEVRAEAAAQETKAAKRRVASGE